MKNQKGFTLIELVMVILLLGILAAVAIPRFWDLGSDADRAAAQGGIAGIKSGVAILNASVRVNGGSTTYTTGYPGNPIHGDVVSDLYSRTTNIAGTANCTDIGLNGQWSVTDVAATGSTTVIYYKWKSAKKYSSFGYSSATGIIGNVPGEGTCT